MDIDKDIVIDKDGLMDNKSENEKKKKKMDTVEKARGSWHISPFAR